MEENLDSTENLEGGPALIEGKPVIEGAVYADGGEIEKQDYFETRIKKPGVTVENLFHLYGADNFNETFKAKEDYWADEEIQNKFVESFGTKAKFKFNEVYNNSVREFSNFKLGKYTKSRSGYELIRDDLSDLRSNVIMRHTNMAGTLELGTGWTDPTKDYRENFTNIRTKFTDENGDVQWKIEKYSSEKLKELEEDDSFGGLAYSDAFYNIDPNVGVDGLYYDAIYDGKIQNEATGELMDVRNDQIVSRWDIDTGHGRFDDIFKNNKIEADGVLDYAKLFVKAPMNMAVNMLDTTIQLGRAITAGGNGLFNLFRDEDLSVESNSFYKMLTTMGIRAKAHNTSMTREALQDGFFGSVEAFLTTTADVALQVALAGGLGRAGAGLAGIMTKGMAPKVVQQATKRASEIAVRATLTSMAAKDSYNDAIENGFTTTEASLITGAMVAALWKATEYASYIFGEYEIKLLRQNIRSAMKHEQETFLKKAFGELTEKILKTGGPPDAGKGMKALLRGQTIVNRVFGKVVKSLPPNRWAYAARQEGLEEMTEELFQDGVKHVASAYGVLVNNARGVRKGRYLTIFDEGYFRDAAERYATSGVAGAMGGPMGISMMGRVNLSPVTATSSLTDILLAGNKSELVNVLNDMKTNGELGPTSLSVKYNIELDAFDPIVEGSGAESLSDMVYNTYIHDINVVDIFINQGMMGQAKAMLARDPGLVEHINENNAMRKDLANLMGNLLDFHQKKGISINIYPELDGLTDQEFALRAPEVIKEIQAKVVNMLAEIKEIEARKKNKTTPAQEEEKATTNKKPKTEKKEKGKSVIEDEDTLLKRLNDEVELSKDVTKEDIFKVLSDYRKIRAIATGAASEFYLNQNEFSNDPVLGAMHLRKPEYEILGENPIKDLLFSMRVRNLKDQKNHLLKEQKSTETEEAVLELKELDDSSMEALIDHLDRSVLTEKALKHIVKLRDNADFTEANLLFDIKHEDSIFDKDEDGNVSEEDMQALYREILSTDEDNVLLLNTSEFHDYLNSTPGEAKKFFKTLSKGVNKAIVPKYDQDMEDGTYSVTDISSIDFIDGMKKRLINESTNTNTQRIDGAIGAVGSKALAFRNNSFKAVFNLNTENFFTADSYERRNINSLLSDSIGEDFLETTLLGKGLSEVSDLTSSSGDGVYVKNDSSKLDAVLEKIEVREALASVLNRYTTNNDMFQHYLKMLADFRRNTLDIIDFKYDPDAVPNTEIEEHPYKDYSVMSDFFTDFMFDPLLLQTAHYTKPELRTKAMETVLRHHKESLELTTDVYQTKEGLTSVGEVDYIALNNHFNSEEMFSNLGDTESIDEAIAFFRSGDKAINVPSEVIKGLEPGGTILLNFQGMARLKMSKWLFKKAQGIISEVTDSTTAIPYLKQKEKDSKATFKVLRNFIEDNKFGAIKTYMEEEVPGYIALTTDEDPKANDIAAMIIKVEKAIFDIYNKKVQLTGNTSDLYTDIDGNNESYIQEYLNGVYLKELTKEGNETVSDASRAITVLVGAITTDFTPFYSEFRSIIEASDTKKDKIVTAAQEFSAKYTAAYISSNAFKKRVDELSAHREAGLNKGQINAIFVSGTAGSGKTTAVTDLGLKIGTTLLRNRGALNTAVIPVSIHEKQVKNIALNVGDLSKGHKGKTITEIIDLLDKAILNQEGPEAKELSDVGVIIIDEVTYVKAHKALGDKTTPQLQELNKLIIKFDSQNGSNIHPLTLVILGDPMQSGHVSAKGDSVFDTSIDRRVTHYLPYMEFSFRSRNSFLVDSISTITGSLSNATKDYSNFRSTKISIDEGTKYGTTEGVLYGMRFVDEVKKSDKKLVSDEFNNLLNDGELADNIEKNILKVQKFNEEKEDSEDKKVFNVLIVPQDISEFKNGSTSGVTKIGTLMNNPKYKAHFDLIEYAAVGGNEANYVIGEFPNQNKGDLPGIGSLNVVATGLNTIATRAFDFIAIVNREESISIKHSNVSKIIPDGRVVIPSKELDKTMKDSIKKQYIEIFDLAKVTSNTKPGEEAKVEIPGQILTPPADSTKEKFDAVTKFITAKGGTLNPKAIIRRVVDNKSTGTWMSDTLKNFFEKLNDVYLSETPDGDQLDMDAISMLDGFREVNETLHDELIALSDYIQANTHGEDGYIFANSLSFAIKMHDFKGDFSKLTYEGDENYNLADVISILNEVINDDSNLDSPRLAVINAAGKIESNLEGYKEAFDEFIEYKFEGDYSLEKDSEEEILLIDTVGELLAHKYKTIGGRLKKGNGVIDMTDILVIATLKNFELHTGAADMSTDTIKAIVQQFNSGLELPQIVLHKEVIADINTLLKRYSRKSVYKVLEDRADLIFQRKEKEDREKKNKGDEDDLDVKMTRFQRLRDKVGISAAITDQKQLFDAIQEKDLELKRKIVSNPKIDYSVDIRNMQEIKEYWHKTFSGLRGMFPSDSYGTGYYDRATRGKETLEDYQTREDTVRGIGEQYTIPMHSYWSKPEPLKLLTTNYKDDGFEYELLDGEEALNKAFNFDGKNEKSLPDRLELRVISRTDTVKHNAFIVAIRGKKKYIISQLNSQAIKAVGEKGYKESKKTVEFLSKVGKATLHKAAIKADNNNRIIDLPLEGDIRDLLRARAGEIIKSEDTGTQGKDLTQLEKAGLNIADVGFVFTAKEGETQTLTFGEGNEVSNVRGEMFGFYSMDHGKKIDSESLTKLVKEGATLKNNRYIINEGTNIAVQLGLIPLKITNNMAMLKEILGNHSGTELGEFPSRFGTALHTYMIEYVKGLTVDANISNSESLLLDFGNLGTFKFTDEDLESFKQMEEDLRNYYTNHPEGKSVKAGVEEALKKMKGEDTLGFLNDIAAGFVHSRISVNRTPNSKASYHILKKHVSGTYIFAINEFLRNSNPAALKKLTELTNVTNFHPKVSAEKGKNAYASTINRDFYKALSPLLVAKMDGVLPPSVLITADGNGAIDRAISNLDKVDVSANVGQNLVDAKVIVQEVIPTSGIASINVISGSDALLKLSREEILDKVAILDKMSKVLAGDKAYIRDKASIDEAAALLHRWSNIHVIIGEEHKASRFLPTVLFKDENFKINNIEGYRDMAKVVLTSILVGYDKLKIAHTTEGIAAKKAALTQLNVSLAPLPEESPLDYKNFLVEFIGDAVDADGTKGIKQVLERCNF